MMAHEPGAAFLGTDSHYLDVARRRDSEFLEAGLCRNAGNHASRPVVIAAVVYRIEVGSRRSMLVRRDPVREASYRGCRPGLSRFQGRATSPRLPADRVLSARLLRKNLGLRQHHLPSYVRDRRIAARQWAWRHRLRRRNPRVRALYLDPLQYLNTGRA